MDLIIQFLIQKGDIEIGDYVIFEHNNILATGIHDYIGALENPEKIFDVKTEGEDIKIGGCVLFGSGAIVFGNVTIDKYCVIGAGSVVAKDIPPYSFAVGIPAKIIKKIKNS